ncbi:hypothetical protein PanWU01x14_356040 [Parasponia andersonii]|uniref:Uncharacterized protein n=1 Tax=Parasponia andersonii TaxID=3476 RepID=A0A2P5A946_PARAD|nr:hypothetical protein PanWU01x14_356040 [Parasponia andersonii]
MNEYRVKESWTKLFSLVASTVTSLFKCVMSLAYVKSANHVVLHIDGEKFLLYDLEMERTKNMGRISGSLRSFETCVCVRNLVGFGVGDSNDTGNAKAKRNKKKKEKRNEKKKEKQQSSEKNQDDFLSKGFKLVLSMELGAQKGMPEVYFNRVRIPSYMVCIAGFLPGFLLI